MLYTLLTSSQALKLILFISLSLSVSLKHLHFRHLSCVGPRPLGTFYIETYSHAGGFEWGQSPTPLTTFAHL